MVGGDGLGARAGRDHQDKGGHEGGESEIHKDVGNGEPDK